MNQTKTRNSTRQQTERGGIPPEVNEDDLKKMNQGPIRRIWENVQLLWKMVLDPSVPWASRAVAIAALAYLVSPLDAIPDALPIVGLSDDIAVVSAAIASLVTEINRCRERM